ncbi:MAG TPA: hypothetical protein VJN62_02210 [Gemmatimonadales bacterium]|nr:hypothetical protein [Gemmatimonadales bacterium]
MQTPLRLGREDVARSGGHPTRATGTRFRSGLSEGRSLIREALTLPPKFQATLWRRFSDDRDLIGLKVALLAGIGILVALIDLVA